MIVLFAFTGAAFADIQPVKSFHERKPTFQGAIFLQVPLSTQMNDDVRS